MKSLLVLTLVMAPATTHAIDYFEEDFPVPPPSVMTPKLGGADIVKDPETLFPNSQGPTIYEALAAVERLLNPIRGNASAFEPLGLGDPLVKEMFDRMNKPFSSSNK